MIEDPLLEEIKQMILDLKHKLSTPLSAKEWEGLSERTGRTPINEDRGDDWWEQGRE